MSAGQLKIHLLSDLHLEFGNKKPKYLSKISTEVDVLVLAGDVGSFSNTENISDYKKHIGYCASLFKHVIVIAGNHEYYGNTLPTVEGYIRNIILDFSNVHFLQRQSIVIDGVRFIGCTLWSEPTIDKHLISDFTKIKYMSIPVYKQLYNTDLKYLTKELLQLPDPDVKTTVVITHHLPSYQLVHQRYIDDPANCFFASNVEHLMKNVDYWLCGHTHTGIYKEINGCKCYINPYGYPFEKKYETKFDDSLIIHL